MDAISALENLTAVIKKDVQESILKEILESKILDFPLSYRFTINELAEKLNFPRKAILKAIEKKEIHYILEGKGDNARKIIHFRDYLNYVAMKKERIGFKP